MLLTPLLASTSPLMLLSERIEELLPAPGLFRVFGCKKSDNYMELFF